VEIERSPPHRSQEFRNVPQPHQVQGDYQEFRFLIDGKVELVPTLPDLRLFRTDAVDGPERTGVSAFIEQGGIDSGMGLIDETIAVQRLEHHLPLDE